MNTDPLPLILAVDDSATDVFFLQHRLAGAGIANPLKHIEDGAQAVVWLERHFESAASEHPRLHLLFLDLNMPGMDGFAVLEWMRARELTDRLTVIVLTTSSEPEDMQRAAHLGAHGYLVKYPKVEELQRVNALALQRAAMQMT